MKVNLIGLKVVQFKDDNGREVNGTNLYCTFADENVTGLRAEKFFVKSEVTLPKELKQNDVLDIQFNMKGKVEAISKAN